MIKFLKVKLNIVKYLCKKAFGYILAFMKRHHCGAAVNMTHVDMASFLAYFGKSKALEYSYELGRFNGAKFGHLTTSISWRPTNSGIEILPFSTSIQRWIASLMRESRVGISLACVWQPLRAGTDAIRAPSSSFSISTVKRYFDIYFVPPFISIARLITGVKQLKLMGAGLPSVSEMRINADD